MADAVKDDPEVENGGDVTPGNPRLRIVTTQAFTLSVGIIVMVLTLYSNNWVIRAQSVFADLEQVNSGFGSFDHAELVVMYDLCDQNEEVLTSSDMARIFQIGKTIQMNDALLAEAQDTATNLLRWPWSAQKVSAEEVKSFEAKGQMGEWAGTSFPANSDQNRASNVSPKHTSETGLALGAQLRNGVPVTLIAEQEELPTRERDILCERFNNDPSDLIQNYRVWRTSIKGFSKELEISRTQPMFTGQGPGTNLVLEHRLRSKMTIVTHWSLPVLNGALGAIIFCLTKMLRDKANAPKLGEVVLRMVFGGFAGLLIATLFLPSGVPLGPYVGSAPGVSLMAFIFGFSLDSFIMLLERLNRLVMDSTRPKTPEG